MLEQIIAGGTNCPQCGADVSSVTGRLFGRHHICPACGCPCMTPGWVYLAALAAGAACSLLYAWIGGWQTEGETVLAGLSIGFLSYVGVGTVLMALVPFRVQEGAEWGTPDSPTMRLFGYAPEDVYHAADNALRRAENYQVTDRDPEELILWGEVSGNGLTRARWQRTIPSKYFSLRMEGMSTGGCRMTAVMTAKVGGLERWQRESELDRIAGLIQAELEHFQYPVSGQR